MTPDTSQKFEIDWLRTAGGAFAAVSSAFLLSTLGAAGTIIGAALGSVIVTVGGALYSQGLAHSHRRLAQVQTAAKRKVGVAQAEVRRANRRQSNGEAADGPLAHADERLDEVKEDLDRAANEPAGLGWRERFVELPWKRISLIAAGLFAAAILVITAIEAVAGESVSSITGGTEGGGRTTLGNIGGDSPTEDNEAPSDDGSSEQPEPTNTPTGEPTPAPETPAPTPTPAEPTPAEPTPTEPTPTAPAEPPAPAETPPAG